ncbi:MAG TPA: GNAT family N-acetyltransferase [Pseudohongiella sp.]|nr:GNAT family N-acetyltransferase [Pseudohongiella sp.]
MSNPFISLPVMQGPTLLLRPLQESDLEDLYQAASDPLIWEQHPDPLRYQRERFEKSYFAGALACSSALLVTDRESGEVLGCSRYYDWEPDKREVAVGYTFIVRSRWGGSTNSELKRLMFDYAFQYVDKIWLHIGKNNWRSRKAAEKIGAVLAHETLREANGQWLEYAYYCVTRDYKD